MNDLEISKFSQATARRAGLVTAFGALVVITAFGLAIFQLEHVERKIETLNLQVQSETKTASILKAQIADTQNELQKYKQMSLQLNKGVEQIWNRNYAKSLEILNNVLDLDSENASALYWKSLALYRLKRYGEAINAASAAIKIDNAFFDPYVTLVFSLNKNGGQTEALERLQYALNLSIDNFNQLVWRQQEINELLLMPSFKQLILDHESKLKKIQQRLKDLGYYDGIPDALVGEKTLTAVNKFCADKGISDNPTVNDLLKLLN